MVLRLKWLIAIGFSLLNIQIAVAQVDSPDAESIKFEKKNIILAGKKITVEIAESEKQHERGLMLRKSLAANHGMLFVFSDEYVRTFWMKNTLIDLSIGYFDKNKKLVDIQEMKAMSSVMQKDLPTYPSAKPAMYALEMTKGWYTKNKISVGAEFKYEIESKK